MLLKRKVKHNGQGRDVHHEQNPPNATYFNPYDAEDIAEKTLFVWENEKSGPDVMMEKLAQDQLPHRIKIFAETFEHFISEAVSFHKRKKLKF